MKLAAFGASRLTAILTNIAAHRVDGWRNALFL
jgi:hypothetical protein